MTNLLVVPTSSDPKRAWITLLAGGIIAALLSWGVGERSLDLFKPPEGRDPQTPDPSLGDPTAHIVRNAAVSYGSQGAILGLILGAVAGIRQRSNLAAGIGGLTGLLLGGVAGGGMAFGLFPLYIKSVDLNSPSMLAPLLTHMGVWLLVGASAGLAYGLGQGGGMATIARSTVGGLLGAILGACLFEVIGALLFPLGKTADPLAAMASARLFAHAGVDLAIGVGITLALHTAPRASASIGLAENAPVQ